MKKILLTLLMLCLPSLAHAATTWYACTSGGNWSANVWTSVLADQGSCAASLGTPVAGDTAILNSSSGNVTLTAAAAAASVTMTGYTGTLAIVAQTLTVTGGTVTLGGTITATTGSMTVGTETLIFSSTTWPGKLSLNGTITLNNAGVASNITGACTAIATSVINLTTTGDTLNCNGGLTSNFALSGTATIILGGGTWTGNTAISNNLTIAGNVTLSGTVTYATGTLLYSSGTVTTTGSTLLLNAGCTLNTSGMTWNTINPSFSTTYTLTSALNSNEITFPNANITWAGAYPITTGVFTHSGNSGFFAIVAGQTFYITQGIYLVEPQGGTMVIESVTASSKAYIVYTGPISSEISVGVPYTDISFSGPPIHSYGSQLLNIYSGGNTAFSAPTLTRTSGIVNVTGTAMNKQKTLYYNGL